MTNCKYTALLAGLSIVALAVSPAVAGDSPYDLYSTLPPIQADAPAAGKPASARAKKKTEPAPATEAADKPATAKKDKADAVKADKAKTDKAKAAAPVIPPGPHQIVVSIDKQRVTLFAGSTAVAQAPISTGTKSHPTPMGVFSVIQKNRHHVSNLYGAAMPFMQRLTWSGTALHQGPLPGYPASHGCIRLPGEFAAMLWKATKIGTRVIVTRGEVAPVEIAHGALFSPKSSVAAAPAPIKTADASNSTVPDALKAVYTTASAGEPAAPATAATDSPPAADAPPTTPTSDPVPVPAPAATAAAPKGEVAGGEAGAATPVPSIPTAERRKGPVSVFISRREGKLYVRQAMEPLFDAPVTIAQPDQTIGTHVYTATELKDGGAALSWTALSIPSSYPREAAPKKAETGKKQRAEPAPAKPVTIEWPSASAALDRITLPPEAAERIARLVVPGSSLIISDNKLSDETGKYTDLIVVTR